VARWQLRTPNSPDWSPRIVTPSFATDYAASPITPQLKISLPRRSLLRGESGSNYREEELFWLYGIAGRVLSNLRRREVRQLRLQGRLSLEREVQHESPLSPEDVARLLIALGQLSPHEREILELLYWEKLSYREISLALGCSENAVGVRLTRARKSLRARLDSSSASVTHLDQERKERGS